MKLNTVFLNPAFLNPAPRILIAGILTLTLAHSPATAQKKKSRKTFAETTSVVVVEIPVTVVQSGEPLGTLTAENFEVFDGKKQQRISGFEVIDLRKIETHDPIERPVPIAARRHFLMFFDLAFSRPESIVKARGAARDLVDSLHPTDLAGVAIYTSTEGARLLLNFTSDRRQLELAINTLGAPTLVNRVPDPLGLVFGSARDFTSQASTVDVPGGSEQREGINEAVNELILEAVGRIAAAERSAQLNKVSAFTGNLEALAQLMASIDGRKHLVYFSEGIPSDLIVGEEQSAEQQAEQMTAAVFERQSSDTTFGSVQAQNQLEGMIEEFRRAGCAIQSVDIGGIQATGAIRGRKSGDESLVAMAKDTGGEIFRNFNDLGLAMEKMLDRTSVTYLLAFQPQNLKLDGGYHRLRVKLTGAPRGTRLSHRSGYYAPKPYDQVDAVERRLDAAEVIMSDRDGGPFGVEVLAAAFPVQGQRAYVPVLLELDGTSLLAAAKDKLELELYAYATDSSGGVHDFFVQNLGLDLGQVRGVLQQTGIKYWGHFDLPPGQYTARVMVRERATGQYTLARRALTVPVFDNSEALLLPPMFPEDPAKWVMVREGENRRRDVPYPFMAGGQPYIPAVKPVVPARGKTPFYLQGLNLAGDVDFAGEVTSAEGAPVKGAALKMTQPTAAGGVHSVTAQLETAGLEPGEYNLLGRATDAAGQPHSCSIRFVVR